MAMDHLPPNPTNAIATIVCVLLFIYYLTSKKPTKNKATLPPEAGGAWPLIGHLHLLGGPEPPHMVLSKMADTKGPIFTIKMGVHRTLIVSNWKMAKDCLTTNDKVFATRPKTLATVVLGYDRAMFGFSPYGHYWRQMRKIATLELLSNHRLDMLKHVRKSEMKKFLKEMYDLWKKSKNSSDKALVEMKKWFGDITRNLILRTIVGKSVGYGGEEESSRVWNKGLRDFFDLSGRFVAADAVPWLRWLDIGGFEKAMIKTSKELDIVVEGWLKEHKEKRASGRNHEEKDFMDVLLDILDETQVDQDQGLDSHTINKATCLALIMAASDTTVVTLTWALSLLLNNPQVLKKAQSELDIHFGRERLVQESDMNNLEYLQAILKETMRLYPAGPLALPHESTEDCTVGGYHIPAGTRLFFNIWKIHHDPLVWEHPFGFRPERFLTTNKDFDVRGKNFEFIPFGSGRRICPGISFAMKSMQLTLAALLHSFDVGTPSDELVDMTESIGLSNPKATPLEILLTPRLPPHLYL